MPGIERLPLWIREVLYWLIYAAVLTAVDCLVMRVSFTPTRFFLAAVIVAVCLVAERAWARRSRA